MICPFCQGALDARSMSCERCGAEYPVSGPTLGLRLRSIVIAGVLLIVSALILVDCVLHNLSRSNIVPGARSPDAQRALLMMMQHQQATQNAAPPPARR